jgi:hypothetical protein
MVPYEHSLARSLGKVKQLCGRPPRLLYFSIGLGASPIPSRTALLFLRRPMTRLIAFGLRRTGWTEPPY